MKQSLMGVDLTGKRMIFRPRPIEFQCPHCGYTPLGKVVPDQEVTILRVALSAFCTQCYQEVMLSEGWWKIEINEGEVVIPYTLLEEIPE